ncbi:MAG: S8 family serine peptidase [Nitrospira sp. CR2.1]|nr:S8 family serine peptidase [Nitrospira sp. CR2.1]
MAKKKSSASTAGKGTSRRSSKLKSSDPSSPAGPQPAPTQASEAAVPTDTIPHPKPSVDHDHEERLAKNLVRTVIALPLLDKLNQETAQRLVEPSRPPIIYEVIIDLNLEYPKRRVEARDWVLKTIGDLLARQGRGRAGQRLDRNKSEFNEQYIFASLEGRVIRELVDLDGKEKPDVPGKDGKPRKARAIYQIWEDFKLKAFITSSITTVKADAARVAFTALGDNIVWAVVDSGIQGDHRHFSAHQNLAGQVEEWHYDFTGGADPKKAALVDGMGHGTHVAGIIGGEIPADPALRAGDSHPDILAYSRSLKPDGDQTEREVVYEQIKAASIAGMASRCKLVSLKVLNESGEGSVSNIIAALGHIQRINSFGRHIRIHGVNLSVGYPFEPEWFACGQSQLCVEVNRLVRSGVVVVVAAGNSGYGVLSTDFTGLRSAGIGLTINDPGNADLAITVGSTHRNMPHIYGVSYFSSKGPTGDGRLKPDLVAPGEKILSCAAGHMEKDIQEKIEKDVTYLEHSGTSMAAPHVSGVIAAFMSVRREFIGQPERIKEIFVSTATDLRRERYFQGAGLVDLMRAIQSI